MGRVGFEHHPLAQSKTSISTTSGAKSDARRAPKAPQDRNLAMVIEVWPELPEHIKTAIRALVRTHITEKK
jgi:hypothetical protein